MVRVLTVTLGVLTLVGSVGVGWMAHEVVELSELDVVVVSSLKMLSGSSPTPWLVPEPVDPEPSEEPLPSYKPRHIGTPPPNVTLPPWAQLFIDGRPFPPFDNRTEASRKRGCIANDAFGEGCYFSDAMICVGFGDRLKVGIVVEDGDPLLTTDRWRVKRGEGGIELGGMDGRYFQHAPVTPLQYRSGLTGVEDSYLGTNTTKLWPDGVRTALAGVMK